MLNANRQQLSDAQAQLESMTNSYADLNAQLTAMQGELDSLNTDMVNKQSEIDSLAKENSDLVSSISELEVTLEESKGVSTEVAIAEQTTQATETAQAEQTAPTQSFDPDLQAETIKKLESMGFKMVNPDDFEYSPAGTNDLSGQNIGVWE